MTEPTLKVHNTTYCVRIHESNLALYLPFISNNFTNTDIYLDIYISQNWANIHQAFFTVCVFLDIPTRFPFPYESPQSLVGIPRQLVLFFLHLSLLVIPVPPISRLCVALFIHSKPVDANASSSHFLYGHFLVTFNVFFKFT